MELLAQFADIVLHLDQHLLWLLENYGNWFYLVLFLIIFCETGLVVTPFLPGDSLLFVAGALAAADGIDVATLSTVLMVAAFLGDNTNYWIGHVLGPRVFRGQARWLNRAHLEKTEAFYRRHGGKTVLLARFFPILRTFAPFVAGIGRMPYARFVAFSAAGAVLWINSLVFAGYFFGNIPFIKENLTLVILGIVALSLMPGFIHFLRTRTA
ncbi:DedA family protein [Thiobacter aerophilum]|uniref:DedA family protein n=1 Tax=Thiobacter aerophilum TaxID=3121275 RepID=A0ABV0EIA0_9BURK